MIYMILSVFSWFPFVGAYLRSFSGHFSFSLYFYQLYFIFVLFAFFVTIDGIYQATQVDVKHSLPGGCVENPSVVAQRLKKISMATINCVEKSQKCGLLLNWW